MLKEQGVKGTWVRPENTHLTLAFFKHVAPDDGDRLSMAVEHALADAQLNISFHLGALGCFPTVQKPRVLWIDVAAENNDLSRLKEIIDTASGRLLGEAAESRPFHAHITLTRFKTTKTGLSEKILINSSPRKTFPSRRYPKLTLYRSDLSPGGPHYTVIRELTI